MKRIKNIIDIDNFLFLIDDMYFYHKYFKNIININKELYTTICSIFEEEYGKIKLFEGSKEYYRDFISVEEVINKKLKLIKENGSGIYDVGTGNPKSFYDIANEVCVKNGIENPEQYIEWIPMPDNLKEHYQKYSCAILDYIK